MKLRVALFSLCFVYAMLGSASAATGHCQIAIINDSHEDVMVHATFDDGSVTTFRVLKREPPHYVSLFYHGYCHHGAIVKVIDARHRVLYYQHTSVDSTIRVTPP